MVAPLLSLVCGDGFEVFGLGQSLYVAISAKAVAFDLDEICIVDDAVKDRVGDAGFANPIETLSGRVVMREFFVEWRTLMPEQIVASPFNL